MNQDILYAGAFEDLTAEETQSVDGGVVIIAAVVAGITLKKALVVVGCCAAAGVATGYLVNK